MTDAKKWEIEALKMVAKIQRTKARDTRLRGDELSHNELRIRKKENNC